MENQGGIRLVLGKKRNLGKRIEEMKVGEKLRLTEKIADKDILLYLGLTNDGNPLYIQHDFAAETIYEQPIVPTIMLTGIVTSAISKHLPGHGSHIFEHHLIFPKPVYHYAIVAFDFIVSEINVNENKVVIQVKAHDESGDLVVTGTVVAIPPKLRSNHE